MVKRVRVEIDGKRLMEARIAERYSRRLLSEETAKLDPEGEGVSAGMIAQYEHEARSGITPEKLQFLAQVLGVEPKTLVGVQEIGRAEIIAGKA